MNAEQRQRASQLVRSQTEEEAIGEAFALLQELIDAPEPEPVGYTNETELDYVRKYEALPVSGVFWPTSDEDACVALYAAPPANNQSEQHLEMVIERDKLLAALELILEMMDLPPDRNCSCHISPPCNDCVDYSGIREAIKRAEKVLAEVKGQS
jgi:hypothetical protein